MKFTLVFFSFILAFVTGASINDGDQRIVSGTAVTAPVDPTTTGSQFPYVVSIEVANNHICAGFIYTSRWVVTTASCVQGILPGNLKVAAGQLNLIDVESTEVKIGVYRAIPNDLYVSSNRTNDIALLELADYIPLDGLSRNYIKYNEVNSTPLRGTTATFMGWGATVVGGNVSTKLRYGTLTLEESSPDCAGYTQDEFSISNMICAISKPALPSLKPTMSPCNFDEGGPLVQDVETSAGTTTPIAVGILSTHSPNCDPTLPNVFTRLSAHYAWLSRTAGQQP